MADQPAPQGVNLLKELLFEPETKRLDDMGRLIEAQAKATTARDKLLGDRIDAVFERAGTEERLLHSVASIIDGALREAEVARHDQLSRALAPLVVRTIKQQLRDSQDEMVDALYPITGRLVKQYVQAEVNRMMIEINAKLGGRRPPQVAGLSMGEAALAEANKLKVEELFLVRRGSGDLVAHWERPAEGGAAVAQRQGGSNRDVLISGYIGGIMSLSEEAFGAKPGSFRTLALEGGERIFVRGSAAHLLAVRCQGSAVAPVENVIDEVFLDTLERYQKTLASDAARRRAAPGGGSELQRQTDADVAKILPDVVRTLETRTEARQADLAKQNAAAVTTAAKPSFARLYAMAAAVLLPLAAWGAWSAYQTFLTNQTEAAARRVLAGTDAISGIPPRVEVERGGRALTLSGFVPSAGIRDQIVERFAQEVPQATVRNQIGVLPAGSEQAEIAIAELRRDVERQRQDAAAQSITRALVRTQQRLEPLRAGVAQLTRDADPASRAAFSDLGRTLDEAAKLCASALGAAVVDPAQLSSLWQKIAVADAQLAVLQGGGVIKSRSSTDAPPLEPVALAEDAAAVSERLSGVEPGLAQAQTARRISESLAALSAKVDRLKPRTPREEFESLVQSSAVFFGNQTELRDQSQANATLDQLARRLRENPGILLRVVGYTDERGTQALNSGLAQARADRIVALLNERGVPNNRLVGIGRQIAKDLVRSTGPDSANRRVEFEIGFPGEAGSP